jgi:DNA-binding MarR family transcriptional regulator
MTQTSARTLYLVKRAETACRSGLEAVLADVSITPAQYTTLSLLAQASASSAELARRTGVSPQSMGEIIAQLERKALIVRSESPEHRRILSTSLTDEGRVMLKQCDARALQLEHRLLEGLDAAQVQAFRQALDLMRRNSEDR